LEKLVSASYGRTGAAFARLRKASLVAAAIVLLAPGTADASVSITPDVTDKVSAGGVRAMVNVGDRTFIGGSFTGVGGQARSNVAAIKSDGKVDRLFTAGTNGKVLALAASEDGSVIFLGGTFAEAGGAPRANLAAVDAVTGEAVAGWQADTIGVNPDVNTLAVDGNRLYVGGRFTGIDGSSRNRMVALDATTGDLVSEFRPAPNGGVTKILVSPDGATVYAGGAFNTLGGAPRLAAGSVEAANGAATSFAPTGDGGYAVTIGLSPDGERFFYGTANNTLFAYDPAISNDPVWSIKTSGNTQTIAVSNDELWIGGHFSQILTGKIKRNFIASLDPVDGSLNDWNPECTGLKQGVWALTLEGTHLHVGGYFSGFGTVKQRGYARFSQVA
jgi:hypothetical protein